jgi:hypothetical protein
MADMLRWIGALVALALLAACSAEVRGPSVKVRPSVVEVGPDDGGGDFCPPGQAKKGRC